MKTTEEMKVTPDAKEPKKVIPNPKKKSLLKKLDHEAGKLLQILNERANKKSHGRKVRDSEIIAMGLSLVKAEHITQLQEQSLSENDRLGLAHEEYQKAHGKLTLDQFIGKLIRGEIHAGTQK